MARFLKNPEVPDKLHLSFQVRREEHPALLDWLCGLPYGQGSKRVRAILEEAITAASNKAGHVPVQTGVSDHEKSGTSHAVAHASLDDRPLPARQITPTDELTESEKSGISQQDIAAAAANYMRELDNQF